MLILAKSFHEKIFHEIDSCILQKFREMTPLWQSVRLPQIALFANVRALWGRKIEKKKLDVDSCLTGSITA